MAVTGTGTPPTSPNFGAPRFSANDPADFPTQTNGVTDAFDAQAARRGAIVNADIAAAAAIAKTKLAPLDVLDADVDPAAAIQESKLALATDAAPGVGSRRTLGPGAQQACPGNDPRLSPLPVGTIVAYSGTGDPGGNWMIADGRLIDRTQFAAFFAVTGHVYNNGVDPGGNAVRLPDKRGKSSIGALNMGSGAGAPAADNAHFNIALGAKAGEVNHTLASTEMPVHAHGIYDPGHAHSIADPGHNHGGNVAASYVAGGWNLPNTSGSSGNPNTNAGSGGSQWVPWIGAGWSLTQGSHSHGIPSGGTGIGIYSAGTGIGIYNAGSGGAHNVVHPVEADSYIVKVQ